MKGEKREREEIQKEMMKKNSSKNNYQETDLLGYNKN
jgi:hypothetical protein